MTDMSTGVYGAKVQSWRRANPRNLLRCLMEENPKSGKDEIFRKFRSELKGRNRDDLISSIVEYWLTNNYHSLIPKDKTSREKRRSDIDQMKSSMKVNAVKMVLMDLPMFNGKRLRDCTGKDCRKAGGWLTKIASMINAKDIVGQVMSESDLRRIFKEEKPNV